MPYNSLHFNCFSWDTWRNEASRTARRGRNKHSVLLYCSNRRSHPSLFPLNFCQLLSISVNFCQVLSSSVKVCQVLSSSVQFSPVLSSYSISANFWSISSISVNFYQVLSSSVKFSTVHCRGSSPTKRVYRQLTPETTEKPRTNGVLLTDGGWYDTSVAPRALISNGAPRIHRWPRPRTLQRHDNTYHTFTVGTHIKTHTSMSAIYKNVAITPAVSSTGRVGDTQH